MIFDPSLTYVTELTAQEKNDIAQCVFSKQQIRQMKTVSVLANIGVPTAICLLTHCNLFAVIAGFIITDVILHGFDFYLTIIKPHLSIRDGLLSEAKQKLNHAIQYRLELTNKLSKYQNEKSAQKKKEIFATIDEYASCDEEIKRLDTYIKYESEWFEKKLVPYKDEELKNLQVPVKDYSDKRMFFAAFSGQVEQYITLYNINCLKPVAQSLKSLMEILDTKPNGYEIVPQTLYVYINELQKTLVKISTLTNSQIKEHIDDLVKVSNALSKNINRVVEKIKTTDSAEIDLSLSVLIQELEKELV